MHSAQLPYGKNEPKRIVRHDNGLHRIAMLRQSMLNGYRKNIQKAPWHAFANPGGFHFVSILTKEETYGYHTSSPSTSLLIIIVGFDGSVDSVDQLVVDQLEYNRPANHL